MDENGLVKMMEKNRLRSEFYRMVLRKLMVTSLLLSLLSVPF
jgi:hypothetical protein